MRPVSSRVVTLWTSVLFLLAALFSFHGLASAQTAAGAKLRLSQQSLSSQHPMASMTAARRVTRNASLPPNTTASWTGAGGDGNWGTGTNWNPNGAPNSATVDVTIGLTTANVNLNINATTASLTLSNVGDVLGINNNQILTVDGNITNNGQLNMNSVGNNTELIVGASGITLSGTGTLNMSNNTQNLIFGAAAVDKLTNSSTIQGSGNIGSGQMALANSGTIDATQSNTLVIQTSNGDANTGTLEATTGTLVLQGDTITNTGGTIKSTGSAVQLNGVTVNGGTLTTTGSGLIHTVGGQTSTLENLTNSGSYQLDNNASTTLIGTITNSKNINLASGGNITDLVISGNVSLAGTGTVTMSNNTQNFIFGTASSNTLTVGSGQTISGSGNIGFDPFINTPQLTLVNHGIIDATQSSALTIQTSGGTTNTGTLEATTGTLVLNGNTVTQTGTGNISSTGSDVQLVGGVTINGGTLKTSGTGLIHTLGGQTSTLENLTNSGTYQIDNNAVTNLIGTITNNGNINFASVGNPTELVINGNVTLSGTGTLTLSNNGQNLIFGSAGSNVLTVGSGQTISGSGDIGANQMTLVNNGIIDATQSTALVIDTSGGTTNTKTLEATGGGTLILQGETANTITNTAGTISAAASSVVDLRNGIVINGGTITTTGSGLIHTEGGQTGTLENLTNTGNYQVDNNGITVLVGTITNNGNINLASVGNFTDLKLSGNVTLSGTGTLTMSNNANNRIYGLSGSGTEILTNNINISGAGQIGAGQTIIDNTTLGTINANQPTALVISPTATSSAGVTNTGLMEATSGGTLQLNSGTYINAVGSTKGTILANGGTVNLEPGATIVGGTLQSENGGVIQNVGNAATLDGSTSTGAVTLVAGSSLVVVNNTVLDVNGSIVNNGTMTLGSVGNFTDLVVAGTSATLSGTGTLTLSNNANNRIYGAVGSDTLTNQETIQGSGNIGAGQLTLVNSGTVNANQSTALTIQTSGGTTNTGTLEATTGGTLVLDGISGGNITNTGGIIQANGSSGTGNGAAVNLQNGITITGGTLASNSFGSFNIVNGAAPTLSGLTNTGTVNVENNSALNLAGTIVNNGTLNMNSVGNNTELILNGNVTLNGTGTVTLSNNTQNFIFGGVSADVLTVGSTQTIQGAGNIGNGQMALVNNGTINANVSTALTINVSNGTTNTGTMEASSGGSLSLFGGTITNTGAGKIVANPGGTVFLRSGVLVSGGSLTGGGTFVADGNNGFIAATLSGLTNSSTVQVNNNSGLTLAGTITNTGSIQENSVGNVTEILISGNATLTGSGTLTLSNNSQNFILGASGLGTEVFTNASTIQGAGNIGDGAMGLANSGTINANQSNTLFIDVNTKNFNNTGTIEATASGGLVVEGPANSFLNYNSGTNTLTGGTYIANGGNVTLPLGSSGGIATLSAKVTEQGGSQVVNSNNGNANALNGLTSITSTGALTIGGVAFADAGSFSNAGSLTLLTGESFTVGSLSQISGGSLTAGTYVLDANLNLSGAAQTITTNAATLTLAGGTIHNNSGGTNALAGLATNTGKLTIAGTANNVSTSAASFSNPGSLTINAGDNFTAARLSQISGTTLSGGTFVLGGNLNLKATGISVTTNSATLTLAGGTIRSGSANALSALASNTRSLTIAGTSNNVSTTAASFSNTGALTINSGDSFTAGNLTQISGSTLTAGTYVLAGNLDLTASANITTNSAALTLEGGTINTGSTNDLANLDTNTGSFSLASNASFSAVGSFTNSGALTVNKGSTFTVTSGVLTNLSGGTLSGGTFTVGGTLQLPSGNGGIASNAANLTLTGTAAKILDGTSNALTGLNNNTGTLTLTSAATLTTSPSNFSNSGTVVVSKGTTLTVGGTNNSYAQTGGTTTVDGTLSDAGTGAITLTGGTIQGAGTLKGNVSIGGATINVGDSGKSGLLAITGTYTQLATGTMTGLINGTTAGTGFSQIKITGTAALAGTINFTVAAAFQSSLTLGETFSVLNAGSVTGTFSNSTIAINSSFHFTVTYTSTGVVLTVASGPIGAPNSSPAQPATQPASQIARASAELATAKSKNLFLVSALPHGANGASKSADPIMVASLPRLTGRSNAIPVRGPQIISGLRSWERIPVASARRIGQLAVIAQTHATDADSSRATLPASYLRVGQSQAIRAQSPIAAWMGVSANHRVPVRILQPILPRLTR